MWIWICMCLCLYVSQLKVASLASQAKQWYRPGRRGCEAVCPHAARHHYLSQQSPTLSDWVKRKVSGWGGREEDTGKITSAASVRKWCGDPHLWSHMCPRRFMGSNPARTLTGFSSITLFASHHSCSFSKGQRLMEGGLPIPSSEKSRKKIENRPYEGQKPCRAINAECTAAWKPSTKILILSFYTKSMSPSISSIEKKNTVLNLLKGLYLTL